MNKKINRKRPMRESKVTGNWYGIPDIKFVWHNTQSDPGLIYDGKYFNASEVEDALWNDFREYCEETGVVEDYDMFEQWVKENVHDVYIWLEAFEDAGAYEEIEEVSNTVPFRGGWRRDGDFIYGESKNRNPMKRNSMKLKINEVRHAELSPSYDSRKSFYGKAHVVTDDDGTEILYSYDTPVVKIKDGKVELLAQWDSSQTTLRHVKEFLQQNGFKVGSKAQIAKMYGRAVESVQKSNRKSIKESMDNKCYVVFRKYYNQYTDSWEPIAFYWGDNIIATYGRINITEQDGNVPYMKSPRYVHDEADINYIAKTKALTPDDECYDEFSKFVLDELSEGGQYDVRVKQKIDYNVVRNSWR